MASNKPFPKFIAFGNTLVDQCIKVPNLDVVKRHNLKMDNVAECPQQVLKEVIYDVKRENLKIEVNLGGSAINSCRMLRELGNTRILFCGAAGLDDIGRLVEEQLGQLGIETLLQKDQTEQTGTCVCLIHNVDRCCYANIGASKCFKVNGDLINQMKMLKDVDEKVVVYIEGFFVTERSQVVHSIVQQLSERNSNVTLAVSLSAPYIVENNVADINLLVDEADVVFGNKDEFEVLTKGNNIGTMMEYVFGMSARMTKRNKLIHITNGMQPIETFYLTVNKPFLWDTLEVRVVRQRDIVDTTGAGDAFVTGFFHAFLEDKSTKDCIALGMETAVKKLAKIGGNL